MHMFIALPHDCLPAIGVCPYRRLLAYWHSREACYYHHDFVGFNLHLLTFIEACRHYLGVQYHAAIFIAFDFPRWRTRGQQYADANGDRADVSDVQFHFWIPFCCATAFPSPWHISNMASPMGFEPTLS